MTTQLDKQVTGNVGLYYCCYQLSLRGWNVMPTARNAKGVDIVIYNADATKYLSRRTSPAWRPFATPLWPTSRQQAMAILNGMFNWLVEAEYLAGNPLALRRRPKALARPQQM